MNIFCNIKIKAMLHQIYFVMTKMLMQHENDRTEEVLLDLSIYSSRKWQKLTTKENAA